LQREADAASRELPHVGGEIKVEKVLPCDVSFDTMDDVDEKTRNDKRWNRHGPFAIKDMIEVVGKEYGSIDVLIHSVAFAPEIKNKMIDTSRAGYWTALNISAYSLTALLRAAQPYMENRPGGASAVALTYIGGERVVPHYGGGMSTAKAALQLDAQQLASNLGPKNIRVNLISAGPYASRAAKGIGDIEHMKKYAAERSPLQRPITAEEVANATVFLCSPLASGITGQVLYVDAGYHCMGV
jgi:enoyl-[acyl-carrier protein] reductase I